MLRKFHNSQIKIFSIKLPFLKLKILLWNQNYYVSTSLKIFSYNTALKIVSIHGYNKQLFKKKIIIITVFNDDFTTQVKRHTLNTYL